MEFTTFRFAVFFLSLFIVYWAIPSKVRWICLLIADIVFYSFAGFSCLLLLVFSIVWSYLMGIWIDKADNDRSRKHRLIPGIIIALLFLCFFKYFWCILIVLNTITNVIIYTYLVDNLDIKKLLSLFPGHPGFFID